MLKKFAVVMTLSTAAILPSPPVVAMQQSEQVGDQARLKIAELVVAKLVPPGTYQRLMKDMAQGDILGQVMGMDMGAFAGAAGASKSDVASMSGKSLMDLAAEKDPHFKERMDISMKVMFEEMGALFAPIEPEIRAALANVYARKYDAQQLSDMNAFFSTASGGAFASDFMSNFTNKEIMAASMKAVPAFLEGMPAIIKKVEAATAHLPPMSGKTSDDAVPVTADYAAEEGPSESGTEPWYDRENWSKTDRSKIAALESASDKATGAYLDFEVSAIERARQRYLKSGWTPQPGDEPSTAEDLPVDSASPPVSSQ